MAGVRRRFLILPIVLLGAAGMAVSSINQHVWLLQQSGIERSQPLPVALNLFRDDRMIALRQESKALAESLEYMVWRNQQRSLRQQLLANLQQQLNRKPMDGVLWQSLLNLQSHLPEHTSQRDWSLQRAIRLTQWRVKSFLPLAYHCINLQGALSPDALQQCNVLLASSIDRYPTGTVKRDLGMTAEQLRELQVKAKSVL